jgi:hypothetical protein
MTGTFVAQARRPGVHEGDGSLIQLDPTGHDPQVREEALRVLYRLRAQFLERKDRPSSLLKAVESLIVEYEEKRTQAGGDGSERCLSLTND